MNALPEHSPADVAAMAEAAGLAFAHLARAPAAQRAQLLHGMAEAIEALGEPLIDTVCEESALPRARVQGERARTTAQLRMFADLAAADAWRDVRVDAGDATRVPLPRPAIRSEKRPIGPVAVFGASNFPLAFSIAGGDSAAALAVGCPVLAKAHPAHPRTCALIAAAIRAAVHECGLPAGVFQVYFETGHAAGQALVAHPAIKAGAFTGSRQGGLALWRIAQKRPDPIPFFAEMSSINPVFITPAAAAAQAEALAAGLANSMCLGVGQFCTQPGLIVCVRDSAGALRETLSARIAATPAGDMLTESMAAAYRTAVAQREATSGIAVCARGLAAQTPRQAQAVLHGASLEDFLRHADWQEEIFGPSSLLLEVEHMANFQRVAAALHGQLTATLWHQPEEREACAELYFVLEQKAGRIVYNGYPTGVEVGPATVHGGPFPACTDARFSSVGTRAIERFLRPVAWQSPP